MNLDSTRSDAIKFFEDEKSKIADEDWDEDQGVEKPQALQDADESNQEDEDIFTVMKCFAACGW